MTCRPARAALIDLEGALATDPAKAALTHGGFAPEAARTLLAQVPKEILGAAILGPGGDEAIHGVVDMMNAGVTCDVLQWAVPIHPTVSELIPTLLSEMKPA